MTTMTGETEPARLIPGGEGVDEKAEASRFTKAARTLGAEVTLEPEWGRAGQIRFEHGGVFYYSVGILDVNLQSSSRIARDKHYTAFFLEKAGYPVIPGKTFFSQEVTDRLTNTKWQFDRGMSAASAYAQELGYPVIVKPNSGAEGARVSLVHDEAQLRAALEDIFTKHEVALVQERVSGKDYRVLVFDGEVVAAYERLPLQVVGDGSSTIGTLLEKKMTSLKEQGRRIKTDYGRIDRKLIARGLSRDSVPPTGEMVVLLDNANLSTGGDSRDVMSEIHPEFTKIAQGIAQTMGLHLCGIDLMIEEGIDGAPAKYHVIEVNSSPGITNFAHSGPEQAAQVDALYLRIMQWIERSTAPQM